MKRAVGILLVLACSLSWGTKVVFAHERSYVWTTEYNTLPKGQFELENWVSFKVPDGRATNDNTIEYQEELEYGITDHWNIAHYERWETINRVGPNDDTVYDGFKFETKYRFAEKGKLWVDPLVYLEFRTDVRKEHNVNALEGKVVLSKDFNKWNFAYNQIMDSEVDRGVRTAHEFAFASSYQIHPDVRIGAEFTGQFWAPEGHHNELSLGPTLAYEHKYFWLAVGGRFGLNHAADDKEARIILGIPF